MGNCLPFPNLLGEVCHEKVMIKPGKFSSPTETDSPSSSSPECKRHMGPAISCSAYPEDAMNGSIKKIRLHVPKQELRELVSERTSLGEMLAGVHRGGQHKVDNFVRKWQPLLESIPEAEREVGV